MKFVAKSTDLIKAVQSCSRVIVSASASPILTNILIDCSSKKDAGLIRLFATDLEMYYEIFIEAQIEESGVAMVSSKMFASVLDVFSSTDSITFSCNKENFNIELSGGKTESTLFGMPPDDFPQLPIFDSASPYTFKVPLAKLQSMIKSTSYAVAVDQVKPAYCGLYFKTLEKTLRAVATDGKRLTMSEYKFEDDSIKEHGEIIIISKVINEISKNSCDAQDEVEISIYSNQAAFKTKNYSYYSRLIDGKFPDYNMVIPKEYKIKLSASVSEIMRELRKMMPIASESSNTVKLNISGDKILYSARSPKSGSIRSESTVNVIEGGELEINFNAKYFIDVLSTIKSDECVLEFNLVQSPVKIYPKVELEGEIHVHVLMPVRPGFNV